METDVLEVGARLSILQELMSQMLANIYAKKPDGLQHMVNTVVESITTHGAFSDPRAKEDSEEFEVHVRTLAAGFLKRTEQLRVLIATAQSNT